MNQCYECKHREELPGNCHSQCNKGLAALMKADVMPKVKADSHGIENGWFYFPFNFDPVWLNSCDSFEAKA